MARCTPTGGTRIKFVAYRNSGYDQALTGDYVMSGCLVDKLPALSTRPDIRAPRLPKKRLTPLEPVERPRCGSAAGGGLKKIGRFMASAMKNRSVPWHFSRRMPVLDAAFLCPMSVVSAALRSLL